MGFVYDRKITIQSVIENLSDAGLPCGDPEITKSETKGQVTLLDAGTVITYREDTESGPVFSTVTVENDAVTVVRRGAVSSSMRFSDADDRGIYRVEPYAFDFSLHTLKIRKAFEKGTGKLDLFYLLNVGGADKKVRFSLVTEENRDGN